MVHEQDHGGWRSARYNEHAPGQEMKYQGYQDHKKQSPSMNALQAYVGAESVPQNVPHGHGGHPPSAAPAQQPSPAQVQYQQPEPAAQPAGGEDPTGYSDF